MTQVFLEKYQNRNLLAKTGNAEIYLIHGKVEKQPFILKSLKDHNADLFRQVSQKKRFFREIDFMSSLKHQRISELVDSYSDESEFYLVYPYKKGMTLEQYVNQNERVDLPLALHITVQLLEALEFIHSRGVVHCDISPGNIYLTDNNEVELFDFGLALTEDEALQIQEGQIVGTPPYLSPEQLSFTDFKIDTRTDLFCSAALLYHLVSGKVPFSIKEETVSGYLDAILKSEVQPLHNVPIIINMILLKALKPTPDERYQTATGMRYDLQEALKEIQGDRSSILFPGEKDSIISVNRRKLFIGRMNELRQLKNMFRDFDNGQSKSLLLYGQSGMGKTEIIREFRKSIDDSKIMFLSTKCNRFTANQPFSVFRSLMLEILGKLIKQPHKQKEEIREILNNRLVEQSGIICKLIPEMASLFTKIKEVDLVEQEKEAERAIQSLFMLFKELTSVNRYLLYIDDIQWIDKSSYHIFKRAFDQVMNCMMIFNYRTDNSSGELYIHGEDIRRIGISKFLNIIPFTQDEVGDLIQQRFGAIVNIGILARTLYEKTDKSPFTLTEAIRFLVNQSVLRTDPEKGWYFNKDELEKLPAKFDPIALILNKIDSLENKEKEYLQVASLIEGTFDRKIIEKILNMDRQTSLSISKETEQKGFIIRGLRKGYMFVHDKIQESITLTLERERKFELHELLGRYYDQQIDTDPDSIFHSADHFLKSKSIKEAIIACDRAAYYAKDKLAFDLAIHFFKQASFMSTQCVRLNIPVPIDVLSAQKNLGDLFIHTGRNTQAISLFRKILEDMSLKTEDILELKYKLGFVYHNMADFDKSTGYFCECLSLLGMDFPKYSLHMVFSLTSQIIRQIFHTLGIKRTTKKNDAHIKLAIRIYNKLGYSYFFQDILACLLSGFKALNFADFIEESVEKAETYALHMVPAFHLFFRGRSLRYALASISIAKRINRRDMTALGESFVGLYYYYSGNWFFAEKYLEKSLSSAEQIGDVWSQLLSSEHLKRCKIYKGEFAEAIKYAELTKNLSAICQDKHYILTSISFNCYIKAIRGETLSEGEMNEVFDLLKVAKAPLTHAIIETVLAEIYLIQGEFQKCYDCFKRLFPRIRANNLVQEYVTPMFNILCELFVEELQLRKKGESRLQLSDKEIYSGFQYGLRMGLARGLNFKGHRGGFYRGVGWYLYFKGFKKLGLLMFRKSVSVCHKLSMQYDEAKSLRDLGICLYDLGEVGSGRDYIKESLLLFKQCQSDYMVQGLENTYGLKVSHEPLQENTSKESIVSSAGELSSIRVDTLFEASNSLSEIDDLNHLLKKILIALIKITGAQNGFLFLNDRPELPAQELLMDYEGNSYVLSEVSYSEQIVKWVNHHKQILLIKDGLKSDEFSDCREFGIRSVLCVPLQTKNEYLGCVYLSNNRMADLFNSSSEKSAQILSAQAGIVLENAMLVNNLRKLNSDLEQKVKIQTRDIFNQKNQLEQYTLKLLESERMKDILTGTLVHDIKNYVAGIEGNLKVLLRKYGEEPKTIRNIHNAQDSCHDIINLASNLLDIGKMEEGKLEVRPQLIGSKELLVIIDKFRKDPLFEDKGIRVVYPDLTSEFYIEADLYLLERVFQNLFNNAAKYTPEGGEVRIGYHKEKDEKILYIYNSGDPIPSEVRDSLFEKYSRLGDKRSQYSKGLGLFFCKMVMVSHGGRIYVDTDKGGNYFKMAFHEK